MPPRRAAPPDPAQLSLFAPAPRDPLADAYAEAARVAARLPPGVRFGTSSWSYPGWVGTVWSRPRSTADLARDGLVEYARHPLLRTVGVDRGFYAPIPERDLARYAAQLPEAFLCCVKAPASVTSVARMDHGRGATDLPNPDFLSPARFMADLGDALLRAFLAHTGLVVLEFPPAPRALRLAPDDFAARLDAFLAALPPELPCAVELRDRALLTPRYAAVLAARRVAHVYSYWTAMPMPAAQAAVAPLDAAPVVAVRLLMRPGTTYDERKRGMAPFDRLVDEDPAMRAEVVALARRAVALGRPAFVLVSNKAEGSAPRTVAALAAALADG